MSTCKRAQLVFVFVASLGLLTNGCIHHERKVYPAAEPNSFTSRLEAARAITFMNERDKALASVARDAARAGNVSVTKDAVQNITFMNARDDAAADCALALSEAGNDTAAVEVARMITFLNKRDQVLKKLATGN
jgi:hypothetical protein